MTFLGTDGMGGSVLALPGSAGMFTLVDSLSRISLNASKSEYLRLTTEWRSLKAGMLVCNTWSARYRCLRQLTHHADQLVVGVHLPPNA